MAQRHMVFKTQMKVHFDEADPAGIAFAGGLFTKMHRCFEEFVEALDQDPKEFFLAGGIVTPLRHIEVEYLGPLFPLETYPVEVSVVSISDSSFRLQFEVKKGPKTLSRLVSTHVCCEQATMAKCPVPTSLAENLKKFVRAE